MKKYYLLSTIIVLFILIAVTSCGKDDGDEYVPVPVSPVVLDLNAAPYPKLSDYNFFEGEIKNLQPVYGVLPYDLNSSLFTDYALKKRFIWMPNGVKTNYVSDDKVLDFHTGTVLIKSFYYDNVLPENKTVIIETRLMIKNDSGWVFANYVWNDDQTEAFLNNNAQIKPISISGNRRVMDIDYKIPAIENCITCHTLNELTTSIGTKPQNLNKLYSYNEGQSNQLQKWINFGYLNNTVPSEINSTADWTNENLPLELRVRSYLDINCAHCHSEGGPCDYTPMNLAFSKTTNPVNLGVCIEPQDFASGGQDFLISGQQTAESLLHFRMNNNISFEMMPPLGRTTVHLEAVRLVDEWINSLEPCQ